MTTIKTLALFLLFLGPLCATDCKNHILEYNSEEAPTGVEYVTKNNKLVSFSVGSTVTRRSLFLKYLLDSSGNISSIIQQSFYLLDNQANRLKSPIEEETVIYMVSNNKILSSTSKFKPNAIKKIDLVKYGLEFRELILKKQKQ